MGPASSKWRLRKSNGNCARTRRCYVLSCLELLQHHLWYPQGQGRTNFGVSMSYILRCGRWGRLMGPRASKWRLRKSNGNWQLRQNEALLRPILFGTVAASSLVPTGTRKNKLWCLHVLHSEVRLLMAHSGPGASKWRLRKSDDS